MARAFPAILRAMEELKEMVRGERRGREETFATLGREELRERGDRKQGAIKKHRFIACIEREEASSRCAPVASCLSESLLFDLKLQLPPRESGQESAWRSEWVGGKLIPGQQWGCCKLALDKRV
eukprot:172337-Hanusia_phi.AAC.2